MKLLAFLNNPDWDAPFFKILARNDTGEAPGHQGGMVIPKELRKFFPRLAGRATPENPTIDTKIEAFLYNHDNFVSQVKTRYQNQTWGGERSPETRLTSSLGPIRNLAVGEDIMVFQRHRSTLTLYRLILFKKGTDDYRYLDRIIGLRHYGILFDSPMIEEDLDGAEEEQIEREKNPFTLFDNTPDFTISHSKVIARSYAFRMKVIEIYSLTCSVCGVCLLSPVGTLELDAAHIVPLSKSGTDDARNGIALCKRHHWAFDKGLFGISDERKIIIPESVVTIPSNDSLVELRGSSISESKVENLKASGQAFDWHRTNILIQD